MAFTVSSGSGTLSWYDSTTSAQGGAGTYTFAANDALSVTANPAQGYQFDHFYISGTSSGSTTTNPFTTNVASGFAINAYFVQIGAIQVRLNLGKLHRLHTTRIQRQLQH